MDRPSSLPQREANLFKQVLRHYENRQFKKGLRTAEQILKKHPDHGETLSIKGLILGSLDRKEEAYELIKLGLKKDLKSHVSWHAFGLLYRADKNYEEAIKCYRNALRIDKENFQILRDLSLLQIQSRNYEGFTETRRQIVTLFPKQKASWVGLAVAFFVQGNFEMALQVVEAYENTLPKQDPNTMDLEHSEFLLFKNQILIESGKYEEALEHLNLIEPWVYDEIVLKELRADLNLKLRRFSEAEEHARALIAENPERESYYHLLKQALQLEQDEKIVELYDSISQQYPKAHTPKRLALKFSVGDSFKARIGHYLGDWFRKGAPSLFTNIKGFCSDAGKLALIEEAAVGILDNLRKDGKFEPSQTNKEAPTTMLWTLYFLAQLYDFKGDTEKALAHINEAIAHTPTVVEVVQERARIFKHAGDLQKAMECINQARELDLQDRFINTKCTKYMLRNDTIPQAESTISLFTRAESPDLSTLVDLQCMWFAIESGLSHLRQGNRGKALKRFHQVDQHFNDFVDDQFDFHLYCMRKMNLRAYIGMLRYEDQIRNHKFYLKSALAAAQCYFTLYDLPQKSEAKDSESLENVSEEDRKKALSKLRKAEAKAKAKASNEKPVEAPKGKKEVGKETKKADPDPDGSKLEKTEDPLGEATKFVDTLRLFHPKNVQTHIVACELYLRKKKPLLAIRALKKAIAINPDEPAIHPLAVKFLLQQAEPKELNPVVAEVIKEEIQSLFGGKDASTLNQEYARRHEKSFPHALAVAKGLWAVEGSEKTKAEISTLFDSMDTTSKGFTLKTAEAAHKFLSSLNDETLANRFKAKCQPAFRYSTYFHGPSVNASFVIELPKVEPDL